MSFASQFVGMGERDGMDVLFERQQEQEQDTLFGKSVKVGKEEWLTPPHIIKALGQFDLDPCSPIDRPWETAKANYTILDDGLKNEWLGRVWCNPPYGSKTGVWLNRCANHGDAVALTFARTETRMFFDAVWGKAHAIFFFKGRLRFYHVTGKEGGTAGAPSVLIAYGENNVKALQNSRLNGHLVILQQPHPEAVKVILNDRR